MEEELTAKMHSEFKVDATIDKRHRVGCVWRLVGFDAPKEEVERWADSYGVSYGECMQWKNYWQKLMKKRK